LPDPKPDEDAVQKRPPCTSHLGFRPINSGNIGRNLTSLPACRY
jgi:hypothetical protein